MNGKSLDPNDERITQLKNLFPEVFNENNINFDKLKEILSKQIPDKKEFYQLSWAGKNEARKEIQKQTTATLNRPTLACVPTSKTPAVACVPTSNLSLVGTQARASHILIEGENLEVLRTLQKAYFNKIKMIYIDPPYNTGNDSFVYPDDYKEKKAEYQKRAGIKDENGSLIQDVLFQKNNKDNGQFHSVWLSMMYPRLFLARNLLTDDGVIFISIDDNEAANLKLLCDEIFGEENFVCEFIWNSSTGGGIRSKYVNQNHEYLLCYAKNKHILPMFFAPLSKEAIKMYNKKDEKGLYREKDFAWKNDSQNINQQYLIKCPDNSYVQPKRGYLFRFVKETFEENLKNGNVVFKKTETSPLLDENGKQASWNIYIKKYLGEGTGAPTSIIPNSVVGLSNLGTEMIQKLFGERIFNNSKSIEYINYLMKIATNPNSTDLILDFFAGSGTTAQAVMELNEEDGGNRQCICVQLPEPLDEKSEAYKAGYKTIADITKARIEKVIEKISKARAGKIDFANKPLPSFEHYILSESNFKIWQSEFDNITELNQQLEVFQESQKAESTPENMLLELLLKLGFGFDTAVKEIQLIDNQCIYAVEKNILWVYFGKYNIDFLEKIIQNKPKKIIVLDSCFDDDVSLKNFELELKEKEIQLIII